MMKMNDQLIELMEMMLTLHETYESEIDSFRNRFDFEIHYWWHLRKLKSLLENEFETIRPFTNKDNY